MTPNLHINPWPWATPAKPILLDAEGLPYGERKHVQPERRWWIARAVKTAPPPIDLIRPTLPNRK